MVTCYGAVSEEYGGPGVYQTTPQFWGKITTDYHARNPPRPQNVLGTVFGEPRTKSSITNRWNRMSPLISAFIKCMAFQQANKRSGESCKQTLERAIDAYNAEHEIRWSLHEEYEILSKHPQWLLDQIGASLAADRRAGIDVLSPLRERLDRVADTVPTVTNTARPVGVKRARKGLKELRNIEDEFAREEAQMKEYVATFQKQTEIALARIAESSAKIAEKARTNDLLEIGADDLIITTDTKFMPREVLEVFRIRLAEAMERTAGRREKEVARRAAAAFVVEAARRAAYLAEQEALAGAETPPRDDSDEEDEEEGHSHWIRD